MKNFKKILTEKQQNDLYYHQVKLININLLQVMKVELITDQSKNKRNQLKINLKGK